jgi:two-component system, NtrC family, sensor kinase
MQEEAKRPNRFARGSIPPPPISALRPADAEGSSQQQTSPATPSELDVTPVTETRVTRTPHDVPTDRVDALEKLREQLIQAERLATFGRTVASVVHELGNPLTNILAATAWLELHARDTGWDDESQQRLARVAESAEVMRRFCRDLGDYTRHTPDRAEPVNIDDLIRRALVLCEHEIQAAHVTVAHRRSSSPPLLVGKPRQLVQVFVNLFTNAAQAMQEKAGGHLRVDSNTDPDGCFLSIHVADDGVGIPAGEEARIFDPFVTTKAARNGMGLGLSIVQEIVADHRGTVTVASQEGVGSVFTLRLPL